MERELVYTVALYVVLAVLAFTSLAGALLAFGWLGVGLWMVFRSRSRGLIADASFMVTWPLYILTGK